MPWQQMEQASEAMRAGFLEMMPAWVGDAGWSLAGLKGKAREYKGSYFRTLAGRVAAWEAKTGARVRWGYDADGRGRKRPYVDGVGWLG